MSAFFQRLTKFFRKKSSTSDQDSSADSSSTELPAQRVASAPSAIPSAPKAPTRAPPRNTAEISYRVTPIITTDQKAAAKQDKSEVSSFRASSRPQPPEQRSVRAVAKRDPNEVSVSVSRHKENESSRKNVSSKSTNSKRMQPSPAPAASNPTVPQRVRSKDYTSISMSTVSQEESSRKSPDEAPRERRHSRLNLRDISGRTVRRVKTFVSRPVKDSSLKRFAEIVKAKKAKQAKMQSKLREGEDAFPTARAVDTQQSPTDIGGVSVKDYASTPDVQVSAQVQELPKGYKAIPNNDNKGKLFIKRKNGLQPFWMKYRKPMKKDLAADHQDDAPLNADAVIDVLQGDTTLEEMPRVPIVLDVTNDMKELKRRDKIFFTKEIVYGNSIRTMINLSDCKRKSRAPLPSFQKSEVTFAPEPTQQYQFDRAAWRVSKQVPRPKTTPTDSEATDKECKSE